MSDRDLERLRRQAEQSPQDLSVWLRLGALYERASRLRLAFRAYSRAYAIDPEHPEAEARWRALGGGRAEILQRDLSSSYVGSVRAHAALMLGVVGEPWVQELLVEALQTDPAFQARAGAAMGLGYLGALDATEALLIALDDERPWVRVRAIQALSMLHTPEVPIPAVSIQAAWLEPNAQRWRDWGAAWRAGG